MSNAHCMLCFRQWLILSASATQGILASLPSVMVCGDVTIDSDTILPAGSPVLPNHSAEEGAWPAQRPQIYSGIYSHECMCSRK